MFGGDDNKTLSHYSQDPFIHDLDVYLHGEKDLHKIDINIAFDQKNLRRS